MSDNAPVKDITLWHGIMMSLHSIFCKVSANSSRLFVLLEPHEFLSDPVSTIDYDHLSCNSCMFCMNMKRVQVSMCVRMRRQPPFAITVPSNTIVFGSLQPTLFTATIRTSYLFLSLILINMERC